MGVFIIVMMVNVMKGEWDKCIEVGMDDYIIKLVEFDIFIDKLLLWFNWDSVKVLVFKIFEVEEGILELVIWDKSDVLQWLVGNEVFLKCIVKMVFELFDDCLVDIVNVIDNEDVEVLCQYSYKFKGLVGEIGVKLFYILLQFLEYLGVEQDN